MICALLGGNLALLASQNNWSGIIINGCVRDQLEIMVENIGVKALEVHPKKSEKNDGGEYKVMGLAPYGEPKYKKLITDNLIDDAIKKSADVFITSDLKYHEYFKSDNKLVLLDIGHYESEQYTKNLIFNFLTKKIPNFAIVLSKTNTNPIMYS